MTSIFHKMSLLAQKSAAINLSQGIPESLLDNEWQKAIFNQKQLNWQYMPTEGSNHLLKLLQSMYNCNHVIVTSGCTESLFSSFFSFKQLGYEQIVVPEPFYPFYLGMSNLSNIKFTTSHLIKKNQKYCLNFNEIRHISKIKKSVILINSPHNPTGMVLNQQDWKALIDIAQTNQCAILIDDVYRDFNYIEHEIPYSHLLSSKIDVLIAGSISKSLAASGLRVGWLLGSAWCVGKANHAHAHMSNCVSDLLQQATVTMMSQHDDINKRKVRLSYLKKRDQLYKTLFDKGFEPCFPDGGHFILATLTNNNKSYTSYEICEFMTHKIGVTPLPLDTFYINKKVAIRFSFAVSSEKIAEACTRLKRFEMSALS